MSLARSAGVVLSKELRIELRTRDLTHTVLFFVLMVAGLFSFAFAPTADRIAGTGLPRIHDLVLGGTAKRTLHVTSSATRVGSAVPSSLS